MKNHSFTIPIVHEKKVLALVLAFACAFTMFAGAAFTDSADIQQTEAVDMLTALGVIDGYEDGSFQPDKTVTRAEMAKMIYTIRNGGSDVVTQYEGYTTPFTDVENVNHWAKGYIAYCYANGIIDGKSATTFDPDATVTGTEAAKMALVLIGYDANRAGLVGSAWSTNTINLATQKNLFQNYTISITGGCDRQYAAQLLYNTLWAGTVRWSSDAEGYEDVVDYNQDKNGVVVGLAYVTVAKKYMGLEEVIATYEGDSKANPSALSDGQSRIAYVYDGTPSTATITYVPENGNEWLGESVKVLYKNSKDGTSERPDKYDTIYGMTLSGETTTVTATLSDIGDVDNGKIKVNGTTYSIADGMDINVNTNAIEGEVGSANDFTNVYAINNDIMTITGFKQDSADTLKLVLDDGTVIGAYINHVNFYKVTGLTASKITLGGYGALDIDDTMTLADDVAVNDIVAVTTLYAKDMDDDDAYTTIAKADVVEGVTVTGVRDNGKEVRIDGTWMKYAAINDEVTKVDGNYEDEVELNSTYDFIVYGDTWVAAKKVAASSKDIALVTDIDTGINDQVKVLKSDGSEAVYNIDDNDDDAWDYSDITTTSGGTTTIATRLFSFSLVGDNGIELKNDNTSGSHANTVVGLDFYKTSNTANYVQDNKTIVINGKAMVTADEAVAYIEVSGSSNNDDGFYAYQIDNLKSFTGAQNVEYALNSDGEVVAFFGTLGMKPGSTASNDQYGYVVDDPANTSDANGTKSWTISVWNGTDTVDITVEGTTVKAGVEKGAFIKYALTGEGTAEAGDISVLTQGNMGIVGSYSANRKLLTLINEDGDTTGVYSVADDVVIIGVNTEDKELVEGIGNPIASIKGTDNKYPANIMYVLNNNGTADTTDDEVVAIFVDSNNKIDNSGTVIKDAPAFVET